MKAALNLIVTLFMLCALSGCNYPERTNRPGSVIQSEQTAAAATLAALLTAMPATTTQDTLTSPLVETPGDSQPAQLSSTPSSGETPAVLTEPSLTPTSETTPTPEVTPTRDPTPETTLEPTVPPTPTATDLRVSLGKPAWRDAFANSKNWSAYEDSHVTMQVSGHAMVMTAFNPDRYDSWTFSHPTLKDFYLEITAVTDQCSGGDRYGLLARAPNGEKGYLYGFTCDGQYALRAWDGQSFTKLVDWTASPLIHAGAGQTNRLGIQANGNQLSLYANGNLLTTIEDDSFDKGKFGLFIGAAQTPDFTVQVTEVAYWTLP